MKIENLKKYIEADIPVILWGAPGTGKTAVIEELASHLDWPIETLILSQLDSTDLIGLPIQSNGEVIWAPPSWAKRLSNVKNGILFFDEISCAPPSLQAAALRLIHSRIIGDLNLSHIKIIAAANPAETATDGGWLAPATANRFAHVEYIPDLSSWITGELSGWGKTASSSMSIARAKVCEFLRKNPKNFLLPPSQGKDENAWPSPRAWSACARLLSVGCNPTDIGSLVGNGVAGEFAAWCVSSDLPDPEAILAGSAKLPSRGDQLYASSLAVAAVAVCDHPNRSDRIKRAWEVLGDIRVDVALSAARVLREAAPDLVGESGMKLAERVMGVS